MDAQGHIGNSDATGGATLRLVASNRTDQGGAPHPTLNVTPLVPNSSQVDDNPPPVYVDATAPPDFEKIRRFCEGGRKYDRPVDVRPQAVSQHRRAHWPDMLVHRDHTHLVPIYNAVRATGLPNAMGAQVPVPTRLNIAAWEYYLGILGDRGDILAFIKYGFPTGYAGPTSNTVGVPNHPSADNYPAHINDFITKEMSCNGVVGPFCEPPFRPWCHISPLMSREKGDSGKRRIITDMTHPPQESINAYIVKNGVYGFEQQHTLPTVEMLADVLRDTGSGAYLSSIDVSRAYKNFASDPLDWPLLCFAWGGEYFCDLSMPFGARASSFHMQSVADCITDILRLYGINSMMYLDDLIIISPSEKEAWAHYHTARQLFADLGLPEAEDKAQPPARRVKWLGIQVDAANMTLSIPKEKVDTILAQVALFYNKATINRKQLQSLLGQLLFVAKCVRPARTFVSRLLSALRAAPGNTIRIDDNFKADLAWFLQFCSEWNGVGIITPAEPNRVILVDACLSGVGGTDGERAYARQVSPTYDGVANITELEAMNVVIAQHTFMSQKDRGSHIRIRCDNMAAVHALRTGRANNPILQECARAAWMTQALLGVDISYDHIPGADNDVADALSRAHLTAKDDERAQSLVTFYHLSVSQPCMYFMSHVGAYLLSRSGIVIAPVQGGTAAGDGQGPWYKGESSGSRGHLYRVHEEVRETPPQTNGGHHLRVPGVHRGSHTSPRHYQEQGLTHQDLPETGGRRHTGDRPLQSQEGTRGLRQGQKVQTKKEGPTPHPCHEGWGRTPPRHGCGPGGTRSHSHHLLWSTETVGSGPPVYELVRSSPAPYTSRPETHFPGCLPESEMGKEHAEGFRAESDTPPGGPSIANVPRSSYLREFGRSTYLASDRPAADVPRHSQAHPGITDKEGMGHSFTTGRGRHNKGVTPQPQENGSDGSTCKGMHGGRDPTIRGVEVQRIQDIYRHPNWKGGRRTRRIRA